ncbi:ribonuclease HII [Zhouia sp. PK063]|uniref:ribonuclease HII n=1 Tax=Zhouia sp. PK063 TaxID=3373602 RepID=UPI0037AC8E74
MKKLFYVLAILAIVSCSTSVNTSNNLITYVPQDANTIIKINDFQQLKSEFKNNDFLNELHKTKSFETFSSLFSSLKLIETKKNALLALKDVGKNQVQFLFVTKGDINSIKVDTTLLKSQKKIEYNNFAINELNTSPNPLYYISLNHIFIASSSKLLIENAVRNKEGYEINSRLKKLLSSGSNSVSANIFINHNAENGFLSDILSNTALKKFMAYSNWTSFDINISQSDVKLYGLTIANDSIAKTINLFRKTTSVENNVEQITPINAESVTSYTFNDYKAFKKNSDRFYNPFHKKEDTLFNDVKEIAFINTDAKNVVALRADNVSGFTDMMTSIYGENATDFRNTTIYTLNDSTFLNNSFKPLIQHYNAKFMAFASNFMLISNNDEALKNCIVNIQNGAILSKSDSYQSSKSEITSNATILNTFNLKKINSQGILSDDFSNAVKNLNFDDYPYLLVQTDEDANFAHTNLIIKKAANRSTNDMVTQLYSVKLDANMITQPQYVTNHHTKKQEIVVQDDEFNLYLISTEGKVLWKKKLDSKIQGTIQQVDLYKNGRLQLAFATKHHVEILDRNGNTVKPFPLTFNDDITQPLSIFDYDKTRRYRFVVTQNNQVFMYDKDGNTVKGFLFDKAGSTIINSPKHIRIDRKDYIIVQEKSGKLNILDRIGKTRVSVKGTIDFSGNDIFEYNDSFFTTNATGDGITIDQKGGMIKKQLNLKENHKIDATNKTLVTMSDNILTIKGKKVEMDYGLYTPPKIFYINNKIYVGITDTQTNKVFVFDSNASLLQNFPVYGTSAIDMSDMDNDKKVELTVEGEKNSVLVYKLN